MAAGREDKDVPVLGNAYIYGEVSIRQSLSQKNMVG